jgi:hypothetical protein
MLMESKEHVWTKFPRFLEISGYVAIFSWFVFQIIYFAKIIPDSIAPDEIYHYQLSLLWQAAKGAELKDSIDTYYLGPITHAPYLYHWIMGMLLNLNAFSIHPMHFLRALNVLIGIANFWMTYKFLEVLTNNIYTRLLTLLTLSSTLMFVFLSGMISYDNLVFFFCSASYFFLARLMRSNNLIDILCLGCCSMMGCLVKITFLPLVIPFVAASLWYGRLVLFKKASWRSFFAGKMGKAIVVLFAALFYLNCKLYLTNIIIYKTPGPGCNLIIGKEICDKHFPQSSVENELATQTAGKVRASFDRYLVSYVYRAEETIIGIFGHRSIAPKRKSEHYPYRVALARWEFFRKSGWLTFFLCTLFYAAIVIVQNYLSYTRVGVFGVGLQGRYLFPVLVPFIILLYLPLFEWTPRRFQWLPFLILSCFMLSGGFVIFSRYATQEWFR